MFLIDNNRILKEIVQNINDNIPYSLCQKINVEKKNSYKNSKYVTDVENEKSLTCCGKYSYSILHINMLTCHN